MVSGPDPYDHDPNDAWWRPGWTAQNHSFIPADAEPGPSPFPPAIPLVNIVATYMDDEGAPASGRLLIRPNARYTDTATGSNVMPRVRPYRIHLGRLDIMLPSSDSEALEAPFTYTVREAIPGGRQFAINVPSAKAGTGPVQLYTLRIDDDYIVPIDKMPPTYGWQTYNRG
ncbi:hypothetical protein [Streptomyces luteogriseus]|uniref:hypothetical protein n=1 Tax=Streptomyces luteogriseus TaxID=68233 RepID=UPI0037B21F4E